jgi:hypothetical protein
LERFEDDLEWEWDLDKRVVFSVLQVGAVIPLSPMLTLLVNIR